MLESLTSRSYWAVVIFSLNVGCSKSGPSSTNTIDPGVKVSDPNDAGCSEVNSSDGGLLDAGLSGVVAWLQAPCGWQKTSLPDERAVYREASASQLARIPPLEWAACGAGCESTSLVLGVNGTFASFATVQDDHRQSAYVAVTHHVPFDGNAYFPIRRVVALSDGATVSVLSARYAQHVANKTVYMFDRESAFKLFVSESADVFRAVNAGFDLKKSRWDFKQPWYDGSVSDRYAWCLHAGLGASPPSVIFLCGDQVEMMNQQGSRTLWVVPDSASSLSVGADNGEAVWAQPGDAGTQRSRVRAWTAGGTVVREVVEVDGNACGFGPRDDKTIGFRGESPFGCTQFLSGKRFFRVLPNGELIDGPLIGGDSLAVSRISAGKDYATAFGIAESVDGGEKREFVILIRLADWKMKRFWAPAGWRLAPDGSVVDDEYLYFAQLFDRGNETGLLDMLFRYRLDQFDSFGEPFE